MAYAFGPAILSGCGGGGSSAPPPSPSEPAPGAPPPPAPPPPAPTPPSISQQPADTTVVGGAAVSFSVALNAESDVTYQWLRDGAVILGATQSSFGYASASLLDSGATFSVRIANQVGTTTSQAARLTVVSPAFTLLAGAMGSSLSGPLIDQDGVGSNARFSRTALMAADGAGNLYVAAPGAIRKVTPDGTAATFAGEIGQSGRRDGVGSAARINGLLALAFDRARNLLVVLDVSAGLADPACSPTYPLFCASTTATAYLREVTLDGVVTTRQMLSGLRTFNAIAFAPDGSLFIAGGSANDDIAFNFYPPVACAIYKSVAGGDPVLVAGNPNLRGYKDGSASEALFSRIQGIAADAKGNLYILDRTRVRKLSSDGMVTTLAGGPDVAKAVDGKGTAAAFSYLNAIAVEASGNVLFVDSTLVRRMTPEGSVSSIARVAPADPVMLDGLALGSAGAVHVGGYYYVGRFAPIPG